MEKEVVKFVEAPFSRVPISNVMPMLPWFAPDFPGS